MRMSRKGRHRLEEAERLEEEGRKRWAPVAFRMSRKRRKRLAAAQDGAEPRLKRFVLQNMRMTRSRKRKMREEAAIRQSAQVASISALALLPPVTSEAAGISNAMNDIPAALDTLRNERNRIRDFHAAKRNVQEATAALKQAEQDLQRARQDRENAKKGLTEAQKNLENAQLNLQRIAQELANAQVESAQRTREAIAAQQAVADFAPQVWAQESAVQAAQARRPYRQVMNSWGRSWAICAMNGMIWKSAFVRRGKVWAMRRTACKMSSRWSTVRRRLSRNNRPRKNNGRRMTIS